MPEILGGAERLRSSGDGRETDAPSGRPEDGVTGTAARPPP
ncbi:hypothetical protein ACWF94_31150 [Streptomyces sp. NPDC055078]